MFNRTFNMYDIEDRNFAIYRRNQHIADVATLTEAFSLIACATIASGNGKFREWSIGYYDGVGITLYDVEELCDCTLN